MLTRTDSKAQALARDKRVLAALAEHFNGSASVSLAGKSRKVKDLQQLIHDRGDLTATADAARSKWKTALTAANAKNDEVEAMIVALRLHVLSEYGADSQVSVDFGFDTKPKQPSIETKAAAQAKRAATLAAKKGTAAENPAPAQPKPTP